MKFLLSLGIALFCVHFLTPSAFAIDVVRLNNGQVVTGTVVDEHANTYIDILLENGEHRLIPRTEVTHVEKNVPSKEEREAFGSQSVGFISINLGASYDLSEFYNKSVLFDYGFKVGMVAGQLSYSKMVVALSYDRSSRSLDYGIDGGNEASSSNDLNFQFLFTRLGDSGFYFGPNVGLFIRSITLGSDPSQSQTAFEAGVGFGWDTYLSNSFSVGPDFRYEHAFTTNSNAIFQNESPNTMKATVSGSFHF